MAVFRQIEVHRPFFTFAWKMYVSLSNLYPWLLINDHLQPPSGILKSKTELFPFPPAFICLILIAPHFACLSSCMTGEYRSDDVRIC